jgi:hypothetical protein
VPAFYPLEYKILFYNSARELREKLGEELAKVLAIGRDDGFFIG